MVDIKVVRKQLAAVGYKIPVWQKAEVRELCNALSGEERIVQACNGYYEGGLGLLVATDHRLLLIDRKPMFLTLDAISYGMIQEISLNYRLLNSTIHIWTANKCLDFSSWNHGRVREVLDYAQKSIIASRNHYHADDSPTTEEQPYIHEELPVHSQINYQGLITRSSAIHKPKPAQQLLTGAFAIEPSDLSVAKTNAYRIPSLSGRVFARHYY